MFAVVRSERLLATRLAAVARAMSNANLQQLPEYHQRVKVRTLRMLWLVCCCCSLCCVACHRVEVCPQVSASAVISPRLSLLMRHRYMLPCTAVVLLLVLQVLQRMGYLERDQSVTMKGRVACEVNSGEQCAA